MSAGWNHCFNATFQKVTNPVTANYRYTRGYIKIHRGFYSYLLCTQKGTNTWKYDEITNLVHHYGSKLSEGGNYSVEVTDHSLGAALGTFFGFYAFTDERVTVHKPVQVYTFGGPYVNGYHFSDAFQYQERQRKLQHARFHNSRDWVTHLSFNWTEQQSDRLNNSTAG